MAMFAARFPNLKAYLSSNARAPDALNFEQLLGFLYAVSSAPEAVDVHEWLRFVFDEEPCRQVELDADADRAVLEAMDLFHAINCQVFERKVELPADCRPRPDAIANLDPDCGLSRWSQGFSVGHEWLEGAWEASVLEDDGDDLDWQLGGCMAVLCFFSSRELAQALHEEFHTDAHSLEERARVMLELLPDALNSYADIGRCLAAGDAVQSSESASDEAVNDARWSSCGCGSGRPLQLCCGSRRHLH